MSIVMKRAHVMSEVKDEEYKSEDLLKEVNNMLGRIMSSIKNGEQSLLPLIIKLEQMAGYLKIQRQDKVQKMYKELTTELQAKGLGESQLMLASHYLSLSAAAAEADAGSSLEKLEQLGSVIDKKLGFPGSMSIIAL